MEGESPTKRVSNTWIVVMCILNWGSNKSRKNKSQKSVTQIRLNISQETFLSKLCKSRTKLEIVKEQKKHFTGTLWEFCCMCFLGNFMKLFRITISYRTIVNKGGIDKTFFMKKTIRSLFVICVNYIYYWSFEFMYVLKQYL